MEQIDTGMMDIEEVILMSEIESLKIELAYLESDDFAAIKGLMQDIREVERNIRRKEDELLTMREQRKGE